MVVSAQRRISCAIQTTTFKGIHFAEATVWTIIATMLATITFTKARDSEGREITPKVEHVGDGLVRWALATPVQI